MNIKFIILTVLSCISLNMFSQSYFKGNNKVKTKQELFDSINKTIIEYYQTKIITKSIELDSLESYLINKDFVFNKTKLGYQKELLKKIENKTKSYYKKYDSVFKKREFLKKIRNDNAINYPKIALLNDKTIKYFSFQLDCYRDSMRYSKKMPNYQVKNELFLIQKKQNIFYNMMQEKILSNKEIINIYKDSLFLIFKKNHRVRKLKRIYDMPMKLEKAVQKPLRNNFYITSNYGSRTHPITKKKHFHNGIDLRGKNQNVYAVLPGVVSKVGYDINLGIYVKVQHSKALITTYGHLSKFFVLEETIIDLNKPIGITGSTGRSTAPHLHFSAQLNKKFFNPIYLF